MRELLLVSLDGVTYGIWKESIRAVETVKTSRRLSIARAGFVTLSVVGDHTETLVDLAVCLGHPETAVDCEAHVVRPSSAAGVSGFLVRGEITGVPVDPDACVPLPACLRTTVIGSCMVGGSLPVPLVDLSALSEWVLRAGEGSGTPVNALPADGGVDAREAQRFRIFTVSGSIYAVACGEDTEEPVRPGLPARLPFLPPGVEGITVSRGRILPVVDLLKRLGERQAGEGCQMVVASTGTEGFGLLVDEDRGLWQCGQAEVRDLPPIARTPWMRTAVVQAGFVAPVLEPGMLLACRGDEAMEELPPDIHAPDSTFPSQFNQMDVDVLEFSLLGSTHAVPQSETEGTVPLGIFTEIPFPRKIVAGVTEHDGEILPVVDLARIYGGSHRVVRGMPLILVRNGTFRALVMAGEVIGARRIGRTSQRVVPVVLPYPALYGCYLVENSVRLVLNVEAIALHFGPDQAGLLWSALPNAPRPETARPAPRAQSKEAVEQPRREQPVQEETALLATGSGTGFAAAAERTSGPEAVQAGETPAPAQPAPSEPETRRAVEEAPEHPTPAQPSPEQPVLERPLPEQPVPSLPALEPAALGPLTDSGNQGIALEAKEGGGPSAETPDAGGRAGSARRRLGRRAALFAAGGLLVVGLAAAMLFTSLTVKAGPARSPSPQVPPTLGVERPPADTSASSQLEIVIPAESATDLEIYVVVQGDTLWSISERLTGNPFASVRIAGENKIANPDLIFPGQKIKVVRK
jgi:chemotaxis signal transduction protein/nucleoid-associated protein YgaU